MQGDNADAQFAGIWHIASNKVNPASAKDWRAGLEPVVARYQTNIPRYLRADAAFASPEISMNHKILIQTIALCNNYGL